MTSQFLQRAFIIRRGSFQFSATIHQFDVTLKPRGFPTAQTCSVQKRTFSVFRKLFSSFSNCSLVIFSAFNDSSSSRFWSITLVNSDWIVALKRGHYFHLPFPRTQTSYQNSVLAFSSNWSDSSIVPSCFARDSRSLILEKPRSQISL